MDNLRKWLLNLLYEEHVQSDSGIESIVDDIETKLLKLQKQEIETKDIVNIALEELMELDAMACLVYYTQHTDCSNFDGIRRFINR